MSTTISAGDITIGLWRDATTGAQYRAAYVHGCVLTGPEHADLSDDDLRAEAIREAQRAEVWRATEDPLIVAGCTVQHDPSGQGLAWRTITTQTAPHLLGADTQQAIEAEILDGGQDECGDCVAANGLHYRWS